MFDPHYPISNNPLGLVEVLRDHGISEFGGLFLYMPVPRRATDENAWAWLEAVLVSGGIASGPWRSDAEHASDWIRKIHPKLFSDGTVCFEIYRIDRHRLNDLFDDAFYQGSRSPCSAPKK